MCCTNTCLCPSAAVVEGENKNVIKNVAERHARPDNRTNPKIKKDNKAMSSNLHRVPKCCDSCFLTLTDDIPYWCATCRLYILRVDWTVDHVRMTQEANAPKLTYGCIQERLPFLYLFSSLVFLCQINQKHRIRCRKCSQWFETLEHMKDCIFPKQDDSTNIYALCLSCGHQVTTDR